MRYYVAAAAILVVIVATALSEVWLQIVVGLTFGVIGLVAVLKE